jgi:phosphoribosylformimino-5-aminoimidazole carboxamide ribotide isomerase
VIILPAIDLRDGRCVRLEQGDYARETIFSDDPVAMARHWQAAGAPILHIVDLDGARDGSPSQLDTVAEIVSALDIPVQVGGGVRTEAHADALFGVGVFRIVVGTAAVEEPELIARLLRAYSPQRVNVGVDARDGMVATRGWLHTSERPAEDFIVEMRERGVRRIVYTDIARDGMLTAPNFAATARAAARGVAVIASGGVATTAHLHQLAAIPGVEGAIVGRALYTGDVELSAEDWVIDARGSQEGVSP